MSMYRNQDDDQDEDTPEQRWLSVCDAVDACGREAFGGAYISVVDFGEITSGMLVMIDWQELAEIRVTMARSPSRALNN